MEKEIEVKKRGRKRGSVNAKNAEHGPNDTIEKKKERKPKSLIAKGFEKKKLITKRKKHVRKADFIIPESTEVREILTVVKKLNYVNLKSLNMAITKILIDRKEQRIQEIKQELKELES